jgi:phosphoglucomutase
MTDETYASMLALAEEGVSKYLKQAMEEGRIERQSYEAAVRNTMPNLRAWLTDPDIDRLSRHAKEGICNAIQQGQWEGIVNAFRQTLRFGTGGIRGVMAFDLASIQLMRDQGLDVPVLKGPNTLNDLVLLRTSAGVAKFGRARPEPFQSIVIGYDSRVRGHDLAQLVAQLFLANDYTVYFFDAPCPYPEVTFAIPNLGADMGILISASHNDYRYNGYKLSCANGSQFDPKLRDEMYNQYIAKSTFKDVQICPFKDAKDGKLIFLGGDEPLAGHDYAGKAGSLINMHQRHLAQVRQFLLNDDLKRQQADAADPLRIAYCAYHGAGRDAVPWLLGNVGFRDIGIITARGLNDLDGMFPSFPNAAGKEQQPDPGDRRAARRAMDAFESQCPGQLGKTDLLIGTDPDADRCGIVVPVPQGQRHLYDGADHALLPADDAWALLLWYRLQNELTGRKAAAKAAKEFIVLSHTTSDSISMLARKHGLGVVKTWVGFASLANATQAVWDHKTKPLLGLVEGRDGKKYVDICHPTVCGCQGMDVRGRAINVAAMEQSNGFSLLGGRPPNDRSLGVGGHVRDKDGILAALLMAEVAAWAKARGTGLIELLDEHIYLDPQIGLFVNMYEPDPLDGEYPGIEGDRLKMAALRRALGYLQFALCGDLTVGGLPVTGACVYRTGKYDAIYAPTWDFQFPDEGVRFFFSQDRLSHVTIRPSGTGNSMRFHVQLHDLPTRANLVDKKQQLQQQAKRIIDDVREKLKLPRTIG